MTVNMQDTTVAADEVHLRLLETTDLHVHLLGYDYYADRPDPSVGLDGTARLIEQARAEAANTLLLDNGDFLQGTPMADVFARNGDGSSQGVHPVMAAMNTLGYDAGTIGNHEFNYGLQFLMETLRGAQFPVVSANVLLERGETATGDRTLLPPYVLLDRVVTDGAGRRHPLRIGVIGLLPPQILVWEHRHLDGRVQVRDIVDAACAWIPRMRAEGADLVIGLAHTGIAATENEDGLENAAIPLARLAGLDAMMLGHTHQVFPGPSFANLPGVDARRGLICGVPTVKAGFWGSHLGLIDLWIAREDGCWSIRRSRSEARPMLADRSDPLPVRPAASMPVGRGMTDRPAPYRTATAAGSGTAAARVARVVASAHAVTLAAVRSPVGETLAPLTSYFALVGHAPGSALIAAAQIDHIRAKMRGTAHEALPILAAVAPFKAGGRAGPRHYTDIPAGLVALRHVADLYCYPNTIAALRVTGADLVDWLERAASLFATIPPGAQEAMLIDPSMPTYNFDTIFGVEYEIDITVPPLYGSDGSRIRTCPGRIRNLRHKGRAVQHDDPFIVASNSYRAGGGGNFPGTGIRHLVYDGAEANRDLLQAHIARLGCVPEQGPGPWRFAPKARGSVLFETGPAALIHMEDVAHLEPEVHGTTPEGFLTLRLSLGVGRATSSDG